ncbi:MAG: Ig-like domain-containing protein [Eubacteriales bacterium]|nr:Ig-like domain-containing protein [Eubacteriales bacterium]
MKKRAAVILITALLLFAFGGAAVFAAGSSDAGSSFRLVNTTPSDGYKRVQAQNVMIKLDFNSDVNSSEAKQVNKDKFTFQNANGKNVDFKVFYDGSDSRRICLLAEDNLQVNKSYTVTIDGSLVNNSGSALGKDQTIDFTTKKSGGGVVYVLLMVAMMAAMMFFTFREQRKQKEDEVVESGKIDPKLQKNPYKLAKEKGISVEEANRIINKEKAKEQKKIDKKNKKEAKLEKLIEEDPEEYQVFKMHTKRVANKKIKR